ncbi:MAG: methylmalonyl-CoA epimerase [Candidatus Marinimicrobia bacterium]|nr:methylmalonyl-CoA epimerase [Candidatus Neomarinimicrobiota bacterium]
MVKKINHIAIAAKSLEPVREMLSSVFGLESDATHKVGDQKLIADMFRLGDTTIEWMEPTDETSPIAKFLEKRGEGIHHICLEVEDLNDALERCRQNGIRLIDEEPRLGAEGDKIAFLHPKSTHGVLIELLEEK